jgi:uncharacterized protein
MSLIEQIQKDITVAMKSREEQRLSTLRMVKTALKNREIEKMAPLDDKESQQVLTTLIKQRKDSIEQFLKGGRKEMADKEAAEITLIEAYLPKAAAEEQVVAGVRAVIAEMGAPTMKEMGAVMKNVMARFAGAGVRVDGKQVSDAVKRELAGK